jgi:hypothetical protein
VLALRRAPGARSDGRAYVDDVRAGARGAPAQARGVRVHSDEEALGSVTSEDARQPAVAGADVDGDSALEAGDEISESVIGALEALAADDVHHPVFYGRSLSASSRV